MVGLVWTPLSHHGVRLRGGVFKTRVRQPLPLRHHAACPRGAVFPYRQLGNIAPRRRAPRWRRNAVADALVMNIAQRGQAPSWRAKTCPTTRGGEKRWASRNEQVVVPTGNGPLKTSPVTNLTQMLVFHSVHLCVRLRCRWK